MDGRTRSAINSLRGYASPGEGLTLGELPTDGDLIDLQSFAIRLGRVSWRQRDSVDALKTLRDCLEPHRQTHPETGSPWIIHVQLAYVSVGVTTIDALLDLESFAAPWAPDQFETMAWTIVRSGGIAERPIDVAIVRSILQPLDRGERQTFRRSLAALDAALALLNVAGLDGRIPAITSRQVYLELGALQAVLSGVLEESRGSRDEEAASE